MGMNDIMFFSVEKEIIIEATNRYGVKYIKFNKEILF